MTQSDFVRCLLDAANASIAGYWLELPDEQRLRLGGMEEELGAVFEKVEAGLWQLVAEHVDTLAVQLHGQCGCGRLFEKRKDSVKLCVLGHNVAFPCTYLYCRRCRRGQNPVRRWLGLESGGVSLGFERALTDLTTRMTFGDAVASMQEHHNQPVDRTKAERVTYAVARDAEAYLAQRRHHGRQELCSGERDDADQLVFTADGGAVPVGKLERQRTQGGKKTEVRKLPKGTRTISGREARFIAVHEAEENDSRVVDCHIAPYDTSAFTGERMLAAAVEAGLGDTSQIHGVFDMGKWIHTQFEKQFFAYAHTACADIMHVAEYLVDAGKVLVGDDKAFGWAMEHKRCLLAGEFEYVQAQLAAHRCTDGCRKGDHGKCPVQVAHGYLENNQKYMRDYADLMTRNLPVGSGEAESGIRHVIKRRMAIAGAWTEENAALLLGLLAIRASGWWDDFWQWQDRRDKAAWAERQKSNHRVLFRNKRRQQPRRAAA